MKRLIVIFTVSMFLSCNQKHDLKKNDFDEVIHYYFKSTIDYRELEKDKNFNDFYTGSGHASKFNEIEEELIKYHYLVKSIPKQNIAKINHALANDIGLKYNEVACIPFYNDVLVLKKNGKTKAIIKICFHCGMNSVCGKIENNFDLDNNQDNPKFSVYDNLYFALYNKKKPKDFR